MRRRYTLLFYLALPFIVARLFWRARRVPAYKQRMAERFAHFDVPALGKPVWIHAVSLGEAIAAIPLINGLRERFPERSIIVTTTTPSGSERIQTTLKDNVFHIYFPYDLPPIIDRFLQKIQPCLAIMIETELWPNLFHACGNKNIPVIIANARLSEKSMLSYRRFSQITKEMLSHVDLLISQTQVEAERFISLGLAPEKIKVTGSIKFDIKIPDDLTTQARTLRHQYGDQRSVLIAASTHKGEDEIILDAFQILRQTTPNLLLILVPRHSDRFQDVAQLCITRSYRIAKRSQHLADMQPIDILVGDTVGELLLLYATADIAFVGGSFVPVGGHNLLEPAALGVPVLTGSHIFNFTEIYHLLQNAGSVFTVNNAKELATQVSELLSNPTLRNSAGEQGQKVIEKNRGALKAHLELLGDYLKVLG